MSRAFLLDVNLLVALFDPDHIHHETAHDWFADHRTEGWATCALTENGLVRVLANPKYGSPVSGVVAVLDRLRKFRQSGHHAFWDDSVSLAESALFTPAYIRGHRQVTDVYLLGLARKHGGRLATFDRSISVQAVAGASPRDLEIIGPVDEN